jgi:hypothetical protein
MKSQMIVGHYDVVWKEGRKNSPVALRRGNKTHFFLDSVFTNPRFFIDRSFEIFIHRDGSTSSRGFQGGRGVFSAKVRR